MIFVILALGIVNFILGVIIMADTSKLTAATAKLSADVDALIAAQANAGQPAIDAATDAVNAVDAKVVAATPTA